MNQPQVAILAIGTELTSGQVTNRNAPWLAQRLTDLGCDVRIHVAVPDDRPLMTEALQRCLALGVRYIFVTGGLGPTSDDFTREVIGDFAGRKMEWREESWTRIQQRLGSLGVPVAESNRQQCWYPEGSEVFPNDRGTADAFALNVGRARMWVLPGPPLELEGIWERFIDPELQREVPRGEGTKLMTWGCIGKSEAALAEIVEQTLAGSGLAIGYRAHMPYIEIKVWVPQARLVEFQSVLTNLEAVISPWLVVRTGEDVAEMFVSALPLRDPVTIIDNATMGVLGTRLAPLLKERALASNSIVALDTRFEAQTSDPASKAASLLGSTQGITFALAGTTDEGHWCWAARDSLGNIHSHTEQAPYQGAALNAMRNRQAVAELFLKKASSAEMS